MAVSAEGPTRPNWASTAWRMPQRSPLGRNVPRREHQLAGFTCVCHIRSPNIHFQPLKKRVLRSVAADAGKKAAEAAVAGGADEEAAALASAEAAKTIEETTGAVSLLEHFERTYGVLVPGRQPTAAFRRAQLSFARSLAGYSLVSYLFLMKVSAALPPCVHCLLRLAALVARPLALDHHPYLALLPDGMVTRRFYSCTADLMGRASHPSSIHACVEMQSSPATVFFPSC